MQIPNISAAEAKALLEGGGAVLLDVREEREVAYCRIGGSVHIPLGKVREAAPEQLDPASEIVVYCHHGARSMMAAGVLKSLGFERVSNLVGGIEAWSLEVDPSVPRY